MLTTNTEVYYYFYQRSNVKTRTNCPRLPPSEHACLECSPHLRCCSDFYTSDDDQQGVRLRYIGL